MPSPASHLHLHPGSAPYSLPPGEATARRSASCGPGRDPSMETEPCLNLELGLSILQNCAVYAPRLHCVTAAGAVHGSVWGKGWMVAVVKSVGWFRSSMLG